MASPRGNLLIKCVNGIAHLGAPEMGWSPLGNSITAQAGDVVGLTTAGLLGRLNATGSGTIISSGGGIWGILKDAATTDSAGNIITPSAPTGVAPGVPAVLAMPSYGRRVTPASPIAGVQRGQIDYYLPSSTNYFIQRQKVGTRINDSVCGKKCDLVFNTTTLEWEVDTSATSVNDIVIAPASFQMPWWYDNRTLWDSSTFATDTLGAWVVFQVVPAFQAQNLGLRYSSIVS